MVTPLNAPREIRVIASAGRPVSVRLAGRQRRVARISNQWRIDDEWWRQEVSRHYFELELVDGQVITVFHDLVSGRWYQQRY